MKKTFLTLFVALSLMGSFGTASAGNLPYNIGHITQFLNDPNYFNGYTNVGDFDFEGEWEYTAIAFESGNINISKESLGGAPAFSTENLSNWGIWDKIDFMYQNLYFQDSDGPPNVDLDPYYPGLRSNDGYFELYRLTNASNLLTYLNNDIRLSSGTYIVGFNDNGSSACGDFDFDDIIIAMRPSQPVPEPATMLLLGSGLIGLAGFGRKRLLKKQ